MNKKWLLFLTLATLAVVFLVLKNQNLKTISINDHKIKVEIADNPQERQTGLMYRTKLPEDQGMLFIFDAEDKHYFWMKNTNIPLDMVWIDSNKKIIHTEKNVPPCKQVDPTQIRCPSYGPNDVSKYVLEVNAGWVEKNNVKVNDVLKAKGM